ncbi:Patatin-like protein 3 [Abeliophyllum distichum]|uniref:Patatin-like protein 3 n=1 Tax=Abeliophyllum distichum TaxID=126358 RepID=A0ABD1V3I8_9LAMI
MTHISKEIILKKFEHEDMQPMDCNRMLVLSLGTGVAQKQEKYNAKEAAYWGLIDWLFNKGASPLLDIIGDASTDMVDFHVSTIFQSLHKERNYLRIQRGNSLLEKPVARVNLDTGRQEPVQGEGTNGEALTRFAQQLSNQRKLRQYK